MLNKHLTAFLMGSSLLVVPASQASAGGKDFLIGAIGGAVVGAAIANNRNKKRRTTVRRTTRKAAPVWSAQRQQMFETQTALNYFGFPAGKPDGIAGRNTRSAVSGYQAHMGYPVTGQLTTIERDFLLTSHQRAVAGGAYTQTQIAQNPQGVRGLLIAYRNEQAGGQQFQQQQAFQQQPQQVPQTTIVVNPQQQPATQQPVTVANTAPPAATAGAATGAGALAALPTFAATPQQVSMASRCNEISLVTNSNGGFTTAANVTDASFAMSEQFCLARGYAIANGERLEGQIQGVTKAQIQQQCESFGPAMKDYITSVSLKPRDQVMQEVNAFVLQTGMAPAQLSNTAQICLGVGYRTDNSDVALASTMLLVALGQPAYGELVGHHLIEGFGTTQRTDLAMPWYQQAVASLDGGAAPAFVPGQPDRVQVLKAAMGSMQGGVAPLGQQKSDAGNANGFVVPAFNVPTTNN